MEFLSFEITLSEFKIKFKEKVSGELFFFDDIFKLVNTDFINIAISNKKHYKEGVKFKHEGTESWLRINYDFSYFNSSLLISPNKRKELSSESIFFICNNIINSDVVLIRKCNMAVVMSYRAIELNDSHLMHLALEITNELIAKLDFRKISTINKSDPRHVVISLYYAQMQLAVYIGNEQAFVDSINKALYFSRTLLLSSEHLYSTYFSLVLIYRLCACYLGRKSSFTIYGEACEMLNKAYGNIRKKVVAVELRECAITLQRLAELNDYSNMKININEVDFLKKSSRSLSNLDEFYSSFSKFKKNKIINLLPITNSDRNSITSLKDVSIDLCNKENIKEPYLPIRLWVNTKNNKYLIKKIYHYLIRKIKGNMVCSEDSSHALMKLGLKENKEVSKAIVSKTEFSHITISNKNQSADILRDIAVKFEKCGDIETALKIMEKAKEQRPQGPVINEKIDIYKRNLNLLDSHSKT